MTRERIAVTDCKHAKRIWQYFELQIQREYHLYVELYSLSRKTYSKGLEKSVCNWWCGSCSFPFRTQISVTETFGTEINQRWWNVTDVKKAHQRSNTLSHTDVCKSQWQAHEELCSKHRIVIPHVQGCQESIWVGNVTKFPACRFEWKKGEA